MIFISRPFQSPLLWSYLETWSSSSRIRKLKIPISNHQLLTFLIVCTVSHRQLFFKPSGPPVHWLLHFSQFLSPFIYFPPHPYAFSPPAILKCALNSPISEPLCLMEHSLLSVWFKPSHPSYYKTKVFSWKKPFLTCSNPLLLALTQTEHKFCFTVKCHIWVFLIQL